MKKIIFCLIITLFLTSCGVLQQKKEQITVPDIHTGTKGAVLEFLSNAPPKEIYEDKFFEILVDVQNQGAVDITGGMLVLGVEEQQISIENEKDARFDLDGKSIFNPEGSKTIKEFKAKSRFITPGIESYDTTITATACYSYKTEATEFACIDTDISGRVKTKPCQTKKITVSKGQGAPISIISVEPKMMAHEDPEKIQPEFLIKLRNAGSGQAMIKDKVYDACTGKALGSESWNRAELKAHLSDTLLICKPEIIRLTEDATVICTLEEGIDRTEGTYLAPLSVEVSYGYMDSIAKSVTIKKLVIK